MKKTNLVLSIFLVLISFVSAHTGEDDYNHHGMMSETWGYGGMFFGWLTGLLVIVVLVLLIVWLIKQVNKKNLGEK